MSWIEALRSWADGLSSLAEACRQSGITKNTLRDILDGSREACSRAVARKLSEASGVPIESIPLPVRGIRPCNPQKRSKRHVEGHDGSRVVLRIGARTWCDAQPWIDEATACIARIGLACPWYWPDGSKKVSDVRRIAWWRKREGETCEVYWLDAQGVADVCVSGRVETGERGLRWVAISAPA